VQDEPRARVWGRGAGGFWSEPKVLDGHDAVIEIGSLGIDRPFVPDRSHRLLGQ